LAAGKAEQFATAIRLDRGRDFNELRMARRTLNNFCATSFTTGFGDFPVQAPTKYESSLI
jgi:hypothetical protein